MCCFPPAHSSAPLPPSVRYPSIGLVVNIIYFRTFRDHRNVLHIFDQTFIVLESGGSSTTAQMPPSLVLPLCLRFIPRRHRQADDQPSPLCPPSPSFSQFGAACVKLCCLPPPSLLRKSVSAVSPTLKCQKFEGRFALNMNIQSSFILVDTVDMLTATFAV